MNDVVNFLMKNPVLYLATTANNGNPKVRPFQFMLEKDGRLYFCTSNQKPVYEEMKNNPNIELCISSPDYSWIRLSGKVIFLDDLNIKGEIISGNPLVKSIYKTPDNPIFELFYLENVKATLSDFSGQPPKEYTL